MKPLVPLFALMLGFALPIAAVLVLSSIFAPVDVKTDCMYSIEVEKADEIEIAVSNAVAMLQHRDLVITKLRVEWIPLRGVYSISASGADKKRLNDMNNNKKEKERTQE